MLGRAAVQGLRCVKSNAREECREAGLTVAPNTEGYGTQLAPAIHSTARMSPTHLENKPLPVGVTLLLVLQRRAIREIEINGVGRVLQIRTWKLRLEPLVAEPQGLSVAVALLKRLSRSEHCLLETDVSGENIDRQIGRPAPPGMIARDANHTPVLVTMGSGKA